MNKETIPLTDEQYKEIIKTLRAGFAGSKPSPHIANVLIIEANLGIRITDVCNLKVSDIVFDKGKHRLKIKEQKTGKPRIFVVPEDIYNFIKTAELKKVSARQVQKKLRQVVEYLGYDDSISTHSFRKMFAAKVYKNSGYNIRVTQEVLQHSSPGITQRYIAVTPKDIEEVLNTVTDLL